MKVRCNKGVAIRIWPEPCVGIREDDGEASVGEYIGQPLSVCCSSTRKESSNERLAVWTSCTKDEGGPLWIGFQERVPNQSKRLRSKGVVVSVG